MLFNQQANRLRTDKQKYFSITPKRYRPNDQFVVRPLPISTPIEVEQQHLYPFLLGNIELTNTDKQVYRTAH